LIYLSNANLGFWADGPRGEQWTLNLQVSERTLDILADALQHNRAHSLQVGVRLTNVYSNASQGDLDFGEPVNLFLRPSTDNGDVQFPELAFGQVIYWTLKFAGTTELFDSFTQALPESDTIVPKVPQGPSDAENIVSALERLTASVASMRSGIIRGAWILAAALIISALIM
jgi:hypothetical protein